MDDLAWAEYLERYCDKRGVQHYSMRLDRFRKKLVAEYPDIESSKLTAAVER